MDPRYASYIPNERAERLYICFSARNRALGTFDRYYAPPGIDAAYLRLNCANDWYHNGIPGLGSLDDTLIALRKLIAASGCKTVVCVGSSMGAFGAVWYGVTLGAQVIVAFGPETVMNVLGGFSVEDMKEVPTLKLSDLEQDGSRLYYVSGDLSPVDNYCAAYSKRVLGGEHVVVQGAGHASGKYLKNAGLLADFLESCVADCCFRWSFRRTDAEQLSETIAVDPIDFSEAHIMQYVEGLSFGKDDLLNMLKLFTAKRVFGTASQIAEKLRRNFPEFTEGMFASANLLYKMRRLDAAIDCASRIVAGEPEHYGAHNLLAMAYERQKKNAQALKHCEATLSLGDRPELAAVRQTMLQMKQRLTTG